LLRGALGRHFDELTRQISEFNFEAALKTLHAGANDKKNQGNNSR
jgi:hypothetical protein